MVAKKKQTYSLTEEQIRKVRIAAAQRVIETGDEVSASQIIGELIDSLDASSDEPKKRKSQWGTASPKEGRAIIKESKVGEIFDMSELDDFVSTPDVERARVKRDEEQLDMYSKK